MSSNVYSLFRDGCGCACYCFWSCLQSSPQDYELTEARNGKENMMFTWYEGKIDPSVVC